MKKLICCLLLFSFILSAGCTKKENSIEETRFLMDTPVSITVSGPKEEKILKEKITEAFNVMQDIADESDRYKPSASNGLYALNHFNKEEAFYPGDHLYNLLQMEKTQPYDEIDLTIGALVDLWQEKKNTKSVPSKEEIATALKTVGKDKYTLLPEKRGVILKPNTLLDVGAVAKGYAVDSAYKALSKGETLTSALINAGGNIRVLGDKSNGKPWKIGVQDPRNTDKILGTVELKSGEALATSGDYQRFYEVDGKRYHHILDPKTGEPSRNAISTTVLSTSALTTDFFSTLLFILPKEKAIKLVEDTPQISALLVYGPDDIYVSKNFAPRFTKID